MSASSLGTQNQFRFSFFLSFYQEVDKESEEFKMICDYVSNTHAKTHNHYKLKVQEVCQFFLQVVFYFFFTVLTHKSTITCYF